MQFTEVQKEDIPKITREGKVSPPLIRDFLAANIATAKLDLSDQEKSLESVRATLSNYVRRHELPVKVFSAASGLYLERDENMVQTYRDLNAKAAAKAKAALAASANGGTTQATETDAVEAEVEANA